jgi:hypothetical protein
LLLGLQRHYFGPLRETGGSSHLTFRTAAVEPKQQVLERALAGVPPGARLSLLAEDWWLYWPLRYLAAARPQVSVDLLHVPVAAGALRSRLARGSLVVAFRGASLSRALEASAERGEPLERWSVSDAAGRPLIDVWWAPRAPP